MYLVTQGSRSDYNYKEYFLDAASELSQIPVNMCSTGSIAYIIANGDVYMLNSKKEWVKQ